MSHYRNAAIGTVSCGILLLVAAAALRPLDRAAPGLELGLLLVLVAMAAAAALRARTRCPACGLSFEWGIPGQRVQRAWPARRCGRCGHAFDRPAGDSGVPDR